MPLTSAVRAEPAVFGPVASDPTLSRVLARPAGDGEKVLTAINIARATARARAGSRPARMPALTLATRRTRWSSTSTPRWSRTSWTRCTTSSVCTSTRPSGLVFCVDEKSQIQPVDRSRPVLAMVPGVPQRVTHDDVRAGTTTLFAALELATGKVIGSLHRRHRAEELKKLLITLDKQALEGLDIHLVLDSYATHKTPAIRTRLVAHPRFHRRFTHRIFLAQPRRTLFRRADTDPRPYV